MRFMARLEPVTTRTGSDKGLGIQCSLATQTIPSRFRSQHGPLGNFLETIVTIAEKWFVNKVANHLACLEWASWESGLVNRCAGTQRAGGKEKWLWGIKSLGVKIHTCTGKTQACNVTGKYRVSTHTPSVFEMVSRAGMRFQKKVFPCNRFLHLWISKFCDIFTTLNLSSSLISVYPNNSLSQLCPFQTIAFYKLPFPNFEVYSSINVWFGFVTIAFTNTLLKFVTA